jgi:hypothetical protein
VKRLGSNRHCKGFDARDHLVTMLYAQLSAAGSLRQLEASFNQHMRQHYHLGVDPVRRSTLADANRREIPRCCRAGTGADATRRWRRAPRAGVHAVPVNEHPAERPRLRLTAPTATEHRG